MKTHSGDWLGVGVAALLLVAVGAASATTVPGGGSRRTDCIAEVSSTGTGQGNGFSCTDGDACDQDGAANGSCQFLASLCVNVADPTLPGCQPGSVLPRVRVKTCKGKGDSGGLGSVPPASGQCGPVATVVVPLRRRRGSSRPGTLDVCVRARIGGRVDRDVVRFTCLPASGTTSTTTITTTTTSTSAPGESTTTTSVPGGSTTTTTIPGSQCTPGTPGSGLQAQITAATAGADGVVTVTFTLTDASDPPVHLCPVRTATTDPRQARVRFTIARLEVVTDMQAGFTTDFTRYQNYITTTQTSPITHVSSDQPAYDSNGTLTVLDLGSGTYRYAFRTTLPSDFPADLTHTVGAQIERTFEGLQLVANPVFDFVPNGAPVTTVRELTTTAQCNACHDPLAVHGGGRREVRLCQLCHTDQAIDPDTGNKIDFKVMIHKIHRGKDLPSIAEEGTVGTRYSIIGFGQNELVFGERTRLCQGGRHARLACETDADCPGGACVDALHTCVGGARGGLTCASDADCPGSTCGTTIKTVGVAFPQDLRNCTKCHAEGPGGGATAANYRARPSAAACNACHDDVNPGQTPLPVPAPGGGTQLLTPGTNHPNGAQPDLLCRVCHKAEGDEFDMSVPGAHTIPERSAQLTGLVGEILSATGTPGASPVVMFRISDGSGTPLSSLAGLDRIAFAASGPTTDLGGTTTPVLTVTAVGGGAAGTLTGPDGADVFTYTFPASAKLPADATGSWRVGMEARRPVTVNGETVEEAVQNPVLDFSVDGSPVVARREVVDIANCQRCHGVFSQGFSIHGGTRNQTDYCVICHNPNVSDFARRARSFCAVTCGANKLVDTTAANDDVQLIAPSGSCGSTDTCAVAVGPDGVADSTAAGDDLQRTDVGTSAADPATESIHLKRLIHRLHTGEEQETKPYVIYGFGAAVLGFTPNDFSDILYPGDRRDCVRCHVGQSHLLPLPDGVLPTRAAMVTLNPDSSKWATTPFVESTTGLTPQPPVQAACLACHDGADVQAHAETQTTPSGLEACNVCHEEGKIEAVSEVHAGP